MGLRDDAAVVLEIGAFIKCIFTALGARGLVTAGSAHVIIHLRTAQGLYKCIGHSPVL
jgi:hypothetical protein